MKKAFYIIILTFITILQPALANSLKIGQTAPDFTLYDQHNMPHTLSQYRGKWVVLYFYPKDNTHGCTTQACSFRDNMNRIIHKKAVLLGVSVDNKKSHIKFSEKYNIPFSLLSDTSKQVTKKYGALLNLLVIKVAKRQSFIINPNGDIAKIYKKVNPEKHVKQILADLNSLQMAK
jgi:peroxiredoxin Q/BCP